MVAQLKVPTLETLPRPMSAVSSPSPMVHRLTSAVDGLVRVVTAPYRGFFTEVMAQALHSAGLGTPVLVVQFLKGGIGQGPERPMQLGQNLDWLRCNLSGCIHTAPLTTQETDALQALWHHTRTLVLQNHYDQVILDELSLAVGFGAIPESEVLDLLRDRPSHIDVILTGPAMPPALLEMADQITELRRSHQP